MKYPKIPDEQYQKAIGQLRLVLSDIFHVFSGYGQDIYVPGAIDEVIDACEQFAKRVRGADVPIQISKRRNPRQ